MSQKILSGESLMPSRKEDLMNMEEYDDGINAYQAEDLRTDNPFKLGTDE